MLPGPGKTRRGRSIARQLLEARPAYDIVLLQELFDEDIRRIFSKALRAAFPHRIEKVCDGDLLHEDSGLFLASRLEILERRFEEFRSSASLVTSDFWVDKGVLGARLKLGSRSLLVLDSHLQSDDRHAGKHRRIRSLQIRQLRRFVDRMRKPGEPAILGADLNVVGETPEYRAMLAMLGARDLFREARPADPGFTWDSSGNRFISRRDRHHQRLDYLLALDPRVRVVDARVQPFFEKPGLGLSDHFGVEATVEA